MKKTSAKVSDDLLPEYHLDYNQAKPNRFAGRMADRVVVVLDPDISEVFTTPEAVNSALRALISAMPKERYKKPGQAASHAVSE
jgi:hypothetical protein